MASAVKGPACERETRVRPVALTADPTSFDGAVTIGSTSKSETPTYPAVEHGDAEGYIDEESGSEKKKK